MSHQRGLTLMELLVSLALGVTLSAALVTTYADSRRHQVYAQEMARLQENGRHALRLVTRDFTMAGFQGGIPGVPLPSAETIAVDCGAAPWALDTAAPIDVVSDWSGAGVPTTVAGAVLDCLNADSLLPGSDLLVLRRTGAAPAQFMGTPAPTLTPSRVSSWYLRVEDGLPVRWQQLEARDIAAGRHSVPGLSLWPAIARIYAVQRGTAGVPQLCAESLAGNRMVSRCLVEGVEQMQLEFGLDTDDDGIPEQFVRSPASAELPRIVAARVHLLLRSVRPLSGHRDRHPHVLGATLIPARGDGFLRRVFSRTLVLGRGTRRLDDAA